MNFDEFQQLVKTKQKSNPVWFRLAQDKPPDKGEIECAEQKLAAKFPVEYVKFISEYGGGYFAFANVFSLQQDSVWHIVDTNIKSEAIRKGFVLFSDNGVGDFYGFAVEHSQCQREVYFFDHEQMRWTKTEFENLFDFLRRFALTPG